MKVVFPTCCGVDAHKSFLATTIIKTPKDSLPPGYQKKRFSTFKSDLKCFADWLRANDCLDVCMESTGKYGAPVLNILEKRDVLASIEGYEIAPEQKYRICIVRDHLRYMEKLIERVNICTHTMVKKYAGAVSLLCTIPGIDCSSAITIISEIGVDMARFGSSRRLCCWARPHPWQ